MNTPITLSNGPTDVERWTESLLTGTKRWPGVQHQRMGLGDGLFTNQKLFAEMQSTMREIRMRLRLSKTHQQRAIAFEQAQGARDPMAMKAGWVELTVRSDGELQTALTLARQAYMEAQR